MMGTFGEYMFFLLTAPLRKAKKAVNQFHIFFRITGKLFDACKEDIFRMRQESMITTASEAMLDVHGRDRNMIRLKGETVEGYRIRLMMKAIIAEKAGSKEGILLALAALGYEEARIEPYSTIDPERWAEFVVFMGAGNGQAVRDIATVYQEILLIKQVSSKPAYLVFTDNKPFDNPLFPGKSVTSYTERVLNSSDDLILVRDMKFDSPLFMGIVPSSYSENVLNDSNNLILSPDR